MLKIFPDSLNELKSVRNLTTIAMLLAMAVVFNFFSIDVNQYVTIGFSMLPLSLIGMIFGPIPAGLAGAACDVIGYLIKPTGPYFFGFTFNAFLGGIFYGMLFYKGQANLWRVLVAKLMIMLIINLGFTSIWFRILYQQAFQVFIPMRLLKNVIMYPIECGMIYLVLYYVRRVYRYVFHL